MTSATIETASSDDEEPRSILDPQLAALIRATLAAAGVADDGSDADFEAAIARHLGPDGGADLAAAVGAALLERYAAARSKYGQESPPADAPAITPTVPEGMKLLPTVCSGTCTFPSIAGPIV